jgi:hypothetical protein
MSTPAAPVSGQCYCGAVQFEVTPPTLFCVHCHCSMCRRVHAAAYVTWFGVPYERFRVTHGDADLVRFRSSEHGTRSFCRHCGSALFCESTSHPDWIDVVLANLDGPIDRVPEAHVFVDDRAPWASCDPALPSFGGTTGLEPK